MNYPRGSAFWIIFSVLLAVLAFVTLNGCALMAWSHPQNYTAEQIESLEKLGQDVTTCLTAKGPPPAGAFTTIVRPKGMLPPIVFDSECRIVNR